MNKKVAKVLIVDDDEDILMSLKLLLKQHFADIITEKNVIQLPNLLEKDNYDLILLDMNFSAGLNTGNEGIYWLRTILDKDPAAVVVMMTAYGAVELAVKAIKEGATDFVLKPWDNEKMLATLHSALKLRQSKLEINKLKGKQQQLKKDSDKKYTNFIGESEKMMDVFKTISKVAKTEANVFIIGENGTGKELVARELHRQSKRQDEVFISVDMSSISESLFESELFGSMKGSFTDSKEDRAGRFEVASGGTLFLDEIGNLSLAMQAKILTVLQNREIFRIGSSKAIPIDIRLISATNKNLHDMVSEGTFREDLLYRLNTIQIGLPPLRDRTEDIPLLADHFLSRYAKKYEKQNLKINKSALDHLKSYRWPGNIRELEHAIEKAVILSELDVLKADDFLFHPSKRNEMDDIQSLNIEEMEKVLIKKALLKLRGNMSHVAKELGVSRATLYNKIDRYGI
ncbi:MAG: sigma-54-dependent Fis family transcriptional regulator [Bacteroidetes bacterium]|nr:sigma-54-dependent Fis family transcriptional regulator [Bacteroidota bacterium]MBT3800866.1 sigma-54-dependent Fis family transcriptional regulator [Bacteroidota bacterium]MBT5529719.1 sigma-54-dependent Fis family transcriptional regulator [Cytophagia bacterium]MBT6835775.1 sigma-54-dependent Fis family transcriptional regulator [Bacteroidota bacterium]